MSEKRNLLICIVLHVMGYILTILSIVSGYRIPTESAGNSQQSAADAYTESRVELERLDATNRELERTVEESAGIFEEIRKQNTNQK